MAEAIEAKENLDACEAEIQELYKTLDAMKGAADNCQPLKQHGSSAKTKLKMRKTNVVPDNKVSDCSWYPNDNMHICTVLQDGKIIIYNSKVAKSGMRYYLSQKTWLMAAEFSPNGKRLACAGLDNNVTIHDIPDMAEEGFDPVPSGLKTKSLEKHLGYIGTCKWLGDDRILSASGDKQIMLWDTTLTMGVQKEPLMIFNGHDMDIGSVSTFAGETNLFISGSSDTYAKLWDARINSATNNGCVMSFAGHTAPINDVNYMPNGKAFITASEDGTNKMFDLRCQSQLQSFEADGEDLQSTANCVSKSGAFIFSGYHDGSIRTWDTISGDMIEELKYHGEDEVSSIELSTSGDCFASTTRAQSLNFAVWA
jgi:guanine nucleotide-binding protein G(I)/G(S)/G(T) subunit beta-1